MIIAIAGSVILTRLGLRPLTRLTDHAGRIGRARDLAARISYSGPSDEVGRLTVTFNDMLSRLAVAFNAQQDFLAEAAHELRTPLASLLGNADLLARYGDDLDRRATALAAIRIEGRRTMRLLNDLLRSVQADAGWRLELRPTSLAEVLCSVVENSRLDQTYNTPALATLFLLAHQVEWMLEQVSRTLDETTRDEASARERLASELELLFHSAEVNRNLYLVLFDFVPLGARGERFQSLFRSFFERCRRRDEEIVEQGIRQRVFRRVRPEDAAMTIRALVDGYCLQWLMGPATDPIQSYRDRCRAVLGAFLLRPQP